MMQGIEIKKPPSGKLSGGGESGAAKHPALLIHSTTVTDGAGVPCGVSDAGRRTTARGYARGTVKANERYADELEAAEQKAELYNSSVAFVMGLAEWRSFWTLTLSDEVVGGECLSPDQLRWKFRYVWRALNAELFGKRYTQIVHHGYCAYAMGIEPHSMRNQIHAHVLVDRPVHFTLIHQVWNAIAGFAWIEPVKDIGRGVRYVCKYITKGGQLDYYRPDIYKEPSFKPMWYLEANHVPLSAWNDHR